MKKGQFYRLFYVIIKIRLILTNNGEASPTLKQAIGE